MSFPFSPDIDLDFVNGVYTGVVGAPSSFLTTTRANAGSTDLLFNAAPGAAYNTFAANVPRITPGKGLLAEESKINRLLNSNAPVTQTTAILSTGAYVLWVNGTGSATSSAGTATGTGFGVATNGNPNFFTLTGSGTVVVTVAGSLNAFQLEAGTYPTSLIINAGSVITRNVDGIVLTTPPVFGTAYSIAANVFFNMPVGYNQTQYPGELDDGTANNRVATLRNPNSSIGAMFTVSGGVQTSISNFGRIYSQGFNQFAISCTAGVQFGSTNGLVIINQATGSLPIGINTVRLGATAGPTAPLDGYIQEFAVWATVALNSLQTQIAAGFVPQVFPSPTSQRPIFVRNVLTRKIRGYNNTTDLYGGGSFFTFAGFDPGIYEIGNFSGGAISVLVGSTTYSVADQSFATFNVHPEIGMGLRNVGRA